MLAITNQEDRIGLGEAGRLLGVDPSTVFRWIASGVRGIKLEYARVGRRIVVSREALEAFSRRLVEADGERFARHAPPKPAAITKKPTAAHVRRQRQRVRERLQARGVL